MTIILGKPPYRRERALSQDDLVEGATIGAMQDLIRWIMEADKVVTF